MEDETETPDRPVLLYDGVCRMCSGLTRFVIPRNEEFVFASLQSEAGARLLREHGMDEDQMDTFVLIDGDEYYTKSTAALKLFRSLGLPYSLLYPFIVVPSPVRNVAYDAVASIRYRVFGEKDECELPSPEHRDRFLDW